jgi:alpha-tubulin suppressor-like RCC1 family protein
MRHGTRLNVALSAATVALSAGAEAATLATGAAHTVVVDDSGNVWAWGANASGQLGTGNTTPSPLPVQVTGLSDIVAVAAGGDHTLALESDGTVWAFGENGWGQLGDGTNTDRTSPVQVLTGASQIAAGGTHSLALKPDGTMMAWGRNNYGQLGDGTTTAQNAPQAVPSFSGVAWIAAGSTHSIVAKTNGSVWAWGGNTYGQLGDGSATDRTSPVQTIGLTGVMVAAVAGGEGHTLARTSTGLVYGWGLNNYGQLGDGTGENPRFTPERVADVQNVAVIGAGASHCAAAETDGTVWCWGQGHRGQIGDGDPMPATVPILLAGPADVVDLAASNGDHTAAVTDSGEVWAWGANSDGQIGDGTDLDRMTPVKVMDAGFTLKVGTPIFSVTPGTYFATQSVALSSATSGTTIRYTTDGSEPTPSSTLYTAAIAVNVSTTIKAIAYKTGVADSNVATGAFTLRVVMPVLSPGSGNYSSAQSVSMSTTTSGATIRYTTDGTPPTGSSPVYSSPVGVTGSAWLWAVGSKAGWTDSYFAAGEYMLNFGTLAAPTVTPGTGTSVGSVEVTLSAASGAAIRYTTNGTEPTAASSLYTGAITLTATTTLKAKAFQADWTTSATATETYTLQVAAPTFSPTAGTYAIGQAITLSCATPNATIHYTIDGTEPTASDGSTLSGGTVFVGNFTLKAKAFAANMTASATTSATYSQSGTPAGGAAAGGSAHSLLLKPDGSAEHRRRLRPRLDSRLRAEPHVPVHKHH